MKNKETFGKMSEETFGKMSEETFGNMSETLGTVVEEKDYIPEGFYMDGQLQRVPLGYVATPDKRGYEVVGETTQAGSKIPVSTQPDENNLLHIDTNNYNMSFHSIDAAQYFNIEAIDKNGDIQFDKLHDLFPKDTINRRPFIPTYADSVLFSRGNSDVKEAYSRGGVSN